MTPSLRRVAAFLFGSGACALIYQVAWFRELRLIFGGSTAASSAVMAVFMGGLGIGGLVLGKRADRSPNPFGLYARLELIVTITSAASPLLVRLAQAIYVGVGGSSSLGFFGSTIVRLLLTAIVLGPSTFAMGGTMPAAARAVERSTDTSRSRVATLYGVNTFGAVLGTVAANFVLIEVFGTRTTLWLACLVNALVAVTARAVSRQLIQSTGEPDVPPSSIDTPLETTRASSRLWFPPVAAASAGFAFMLVELVWYRMLAPLLGGSSYTFGLILAVALAGIGLGGALYSFGTRRATLGLFALTCALEASAIAVPFALGDRLAIFALYLSPLAQGSFSGALIAWSLITVVVVLPAAIISGYQFPVIIALYGTGEKDVGSDVGRAYVANTAGSIAGSLSGGFGLLPLLSAPGCWKLVVFLLVVTAVIALGLDMKERGRNATRALLFGGASAAAALFCLAARGPSALWRHSGIGAHRASVGKYSKADIVRFEQQRQTSIAWEADGLESTVALDRGLGYAFIVNGKSDGHIIVDRGTQVMSGLLGALIHGHPRTTMVIGLGTGSTAGWLADIPSVERVDVMELEPAILRVARDCRAANQDVLANPKVHVTIGDAREGLLTSRASYDLIFSEPSNPYRAGVSSLYTLEYYQAVTRRLNDEGVFVQWVQMYDVDPFTVSTVIRTLREVFPSMSLWQAEGGDLLLVAQKRPRTLDLERMRSMIREEPYATALAVAWGTDSLEGVLAHFVATPKFAEIVVENQLGIVNQDDENVLEFAFARHLGQGGRLDVDITQFAERQGVARPIASGTFDEERLTEERMLLQAIRSATIAPNIPSPTEGQELFAKALRHLSQRNPRAGLASWSKLERPPHSYYETHLVTMAMATEGDERLPALLPLLKRPANRLLTEGLWLIKTNKVAEGVDTLVRGFLAVRSDPWVETNLLNESLGAARVVGMIAPMHARALSAALAEPFAGEIARTLRLIAYVQLARRTDDPKNCVEAIARSEPLPFEKELIEGRVACYERAGDPRLPATREELERFHSLTPVFGAGIPSPDKSATSRSE